MSWKRRESQSYGATLPLAEVAWLAGVAARLGAAESLDAIGSACATVLQRFVDFEFTHLFLVDVEDGRLRLVYANGLTEEQRRREESSAPARQPGQVLRTGQPMTVRDVVVDPDKTAAQGPRRAVIRSRLTLPITRDGEVFGAFGLSSLHPDGIDDHDRALLGFVGDMAAIAYHRLRADHRAQKERERHVETERESALLAQQAVDRAQVAADARRFTSALFDISRAPMEGVSRFVELVTTVVARTLGVARASIWRQVEDGLELLDLYETLRDVHSNGLHLSAQVFPPYFDALATEETIVAEDAHTHPATSCFSSSYLTPLGIVSMLDLPLRSFDGVRGVLCIESLERRVWRSDEIRFATEVAGLIVQALDVAVRRQTEQEHAAVLAAERERLQALLSSSSAIIHSARLPEFELDYVSDSYTAVLGYPVDQARAQGVRGQNIHPDDRERVLTTLSSLLSSGHVVDEYRHRHADGSWRWLRAETRVVRDEHGQPLRAVGASIDITSRRRDEVRLSTILAVQQLVARVSSTVLATGAAGLAAAVQECLEGLRRVTAAQRTFAARVVDGAVTEVTEWRVDAAGVEDDEAKARAVVDVTGALPRLARGEAHVATSATTMDARPLFLVPLVVDGHLRGVLGVDAPGVEELPTEETLNLVELVADALSTAQKRAEDEVELQALNAQLKSRADQQRALLELSGTLARATTRDDFYGAVRSWQTTLVGIEHLAFLKHVDGGHVRMRVFARDATTEGPFSSDLLIDPTPSSAFQTALRTGAPVTTLDHAMTAFSDWEALAAQGFLQVAVVPLGASGVLGALVIATRREESWAIEDLSWAVQLGVLFGGHLSTLRAGHALRRINDELERRVGDRTVELRASEERFQLLFQSAPQAMVIADRGGRVVQANRGAQHLFGYDDDTFRGLPLSSLLPVALREHHEELVRAFTVESAVGARAMAPGRTVAGLRQDGTEFPAEIGLVPLVVHGEQQIVAGITDISARIAAQETISRSLREKEVLLKEIHHRVKNNLQIISSLLMLQSEQMPSEDVRRMLHESVYRVRSMALIHQLFYGGQSLDRIDLGAYARGLAASLAGVLAPTAKVEVVADDVAVPVDVAVPLGLILNELLTNAFKYGLPRDAGQARLHGADADVVVEVHVEGSDLQISVQDRGPGLPVELELATATTLGLQLVRSLVRQLRGRLTVVRAPRAGVSLRCPVSQHS